MARGPRAQQDFPARFARLEEQVRQLRIAQSAHTETKTFLLPGPLADIAVIPPCLISLNPDGESPEWKRLFRISAWAMSGGSGSIDFALDNGDATHTLGITGTPTAYTFPTPVDIREDRWAILAAPSPGTVTDLAFAFTLITGR